MLFKNKLGTRFSIGIIASLLVIVAGFFTLTTYLQTKKRLEKDVLAKLHSIAKTLSLSINGDHHKYITTKYPNKNDITNHNSDSLYLGIYQLLNNAKEINELNTNIYTLYIDHSNPKKSDSIYIGVISGNEQYYKHSYSTPPEKLKEKFNEGGKIRRYSDAHGDWISAFSPVKNSKGNVVCVVEVDEKFDKFLDLAKSEAWDNILVSLIFISIVSIVFFYILRHLALLDKEKNLQLKKTFDLLKGQNQKISDSINYALNIQDSILPRSQDLNEVFPESFIYSKAKDVVSGDVPWFYKSKDKIFFAAIDCTGHGVPGALLSVIAYFLLKEITSQNPDIKPGEILELLHKGVVRTLRQQKKSIHNHDGMDISLCSFDLKNKKVYYAGANRPLYILNNQKLTEIKGTRKGIGGTHYDNIKRPFKTTELNLEEGHEFYICSDGFVDQMGGEKDKKFGSKRLKQYLQDKSPAKSMSSFKKDLDDTLTTWKGNHDQIDDILVMGVKV